MIAMLGAVPNLSGRMYKAYGFVIESELELPELQHYDAGPGSRPDITIRVAPASRAAVAAGTDYGPLFRMSPTCVWFDMADVAEFLISDGAEIIVNPKPNADSASVRLFLLGSAFGAALVQRNLLTLHGNAIRIGDRCLICVGDSGAGKSTLAAAFMRRGFDVLSDDVAPIDASGCAIPGFPRIKLWQDAAERLGIETCGLARIRPEFDKYNVPLTGQDGNPARVAWIYALTKAPSTDLEIERVTGAAKYKLLHDYTYRMEFVQGMRRQADHLRRCGELAPRIAMSRVVRPEAGYDVDRLIDRLIADIQDVGAP
jgi:hypothetical protein